MKSIYIDIAKYNLWANQKVVDTLLKLTPEQINTPLGGSFTSIKDTVYHIILAETIWMHRLLLGDQYINPIDNFMGTFEEACHIWISASEKLVAFAQKQFDDKSLEHEVIYKDTKKVQYKNTVWEIIQHCTNHSAYHRGQLINYCRMLAYTKVPTTDYMQYLRQKK